MRALHGFGCVLLVMVAAGSAWGQDVDDDRESSEVDGDTGSDESPDANDGADAEIPPEKKAELEAVRLVKQGQAAWEKGDHATALEYFDLAHDVYPSPRFHYNFGLALSGLGRNVEAIEAFERFLREAHDAPREARAYATAQIAALERKIGKLIVTSNVADASVSIDGKVVTIRQPARVAPGTHTVVAWRTGYDSAVADVEVAAGETQRQRIVLLEKGAAEAAAAAEEAARAAHPVVAAPPPAPRDNRKRRRALAWAGAGVIVAGVVTAVAVSLAGGEGRCPASELGCLDFR